MRSTATSRMRVWFMFDVQMLSEPTYDPAKYIMVQPSDDADWYNKSMVATERRAEGRADRVVEVARRALARHR